MPTLFHRTDWIALAALSAVTGIAVADDVLVVAPADLQPALAEWKAHRARQGTTVIVKEPGADVAATVKAAHAASGGALKFVMIVGDADRVPCAFRPVVATAKWETEPQIATDAPYADIDGDSVPDLAIGRVTADSADEVRAYLARVVAYETSADTRDWRRRVSIVAGTGGFGPIQDAAMEQMTKQFLTRDVPPEFVVTGTYGNPLSAWCPPPAEFASTVLQRFAEGALVVTYIGHGSPNELDKVRMGREKFPIFGATEVAQLESRRGPPVAVLIACSTGRFDSERDCLAEEMLRRPAGPVAVIASSRVSTPYSNSILSKEMLNALFEAKVATVGELLLTMKRRLVAPREGDAERKQIEGLAATFYDPDPARRDADRREHISLYNLLGDPCVRIMRPTDLPLDAAGTVAAGTTLEVKGTAPAAGLLVVEIARRRDAAVTVGSRKTADDWRDTYRRANALEIVRVEVTVRAGPFVVPIAVPTDAKSGPGYVRAYFDGGGVAAAGGRYLDVAPARAPADAPPTAPTDRR
ncbi:MAG: hypothetical protein K8T90_13770 [Planctomycetes bacterium]|nr:hypothetical protein [Planctomycetota bacterium]